MTFEIVHTVPDWYDGPRGGIANYNRAPHLFQSEWRDDEDLYSNTFLLMPVDADTFSLAMEDWAIWRRYETALYKKDVTAEHHPSLPEERARHAELTMLLEGRLEIDPQHAFRKQAEFQPREDKEWSGYGCRPLQVRWINCDETD